MDEQEFADALFEVIEQTTAPYGYEEDILFGARVTRDETGLQVTTPDGDVFRLVVVKVSA